MLTEAQFPPDMANFLTKLWPHEILCYTNLFNAQVPSQLFTSILSLPSQNLFSSYISYDLLPSLVFIVDIYFLVCEKYVLLWAL
jgi:hypothetical protein